MAAILKFIITFWFLPPLTKTMKTFSILQLTHISSSQMSYKTAKPFFRDQCSKKHHITKRRTEVKVEFKNIRLDIVVIV